MRIILLSAAVEKKQVVEALQLGARGVVLKDSATQLLLKSHPRRHGRRILGGPGQRLESRTISPQPDAEHERRNKTEEIRPDAPRTGDRFGSGRGYANREIAEYFKISEDTVKHHLSNIFDKLGVSTRLELALFAVNQGLPLKTIV